MHIPVITPLPFADAPYSRAMFDDDWIFVSGTLGMDYEAHQLADGAAAQTELMLRNIERYLATCGGTLRNIVNYTLIVSAHEHLPAVMDALRKHLPCKPTGTAMIAGIAIPEACVEMQVIARKSHQG
ncbi:MAG: Rid family hydrolase [Ottowia sp.]|uniref:RidA family protein n=1 Tax=Ottowia sp. TaxID=1898956 RepID=UPI003C75E686